jgi:hypothetical protein
MKKLIQLSPLVVILVLVGGFLLLGGLVKPEAPSQPIMFDHWLHVTKSDCEQPENCPQLNCTDCHENADKSSHATIPNVSLCMGCHQVIKADSPEIQKVRGYYERGEQPPWARVYWFARSADVFFTHKPHIRANLDCAECHGQMGQMHRVRREVNQDMGWCVSCHRTRGVSVDCYICHR